MRKFSILCVLLLTFIGCRSRDFQAVTVKDTVVEKSAASDRQKIEEARALIADGSNEFQKGNMDVSLEKAKSSIQTFELVEGYALLGASQYQLGDYENAKSAYEKGNNLDPQNEKILIGLGTVQSTLGENEAALSTYQTLNKLKPDESIYTYKTGILLKNLGRYQESLVTLKSLEDKQDFPYPVELLNQLGDVCLELKKYDEAESYFARAEKLNPELKSAKDAKLSTKIASLIQRGNDFLNKKNYAEATAEFKKAAELQPQNGSVWSFLGNAQLLNGKLKESEESFKKSISLSDTNANAYVGLCNVLIQTHNYSDCLKTSKQALQKIPKNAEIRNKQGICEWKWGEVKKATLSFQDSSAWDPNFIEPKMNLAYVLIDSGRFDEALDVLKKAETHPKAKKEDIRKAKILAESQKFIVSGDSFLRQGKRKQAFDEYGKAMGVNPENPAVQNAYGRAYFAFSEYKKAEGSYLEAYRLDNTNPGALQGLARVYAKTGESKKEKEFIKKLETLSATDPFSAITLGRIAEDASKWDEAESVYMGLKKKFPNNDAVDYRLGSLYYKRAVEENAKENYTKANEFIQKSKKYTKDIPELIETEKTVSENSRFAEILPLVKEGNTLFNRKKYIEAVTPYQKAYDRVPKASLLVKIAECYIEKGEEEKGLSILENAVKSNKENAISFKEGIYSFYYKKGELKRAEDGFYDILREKPDSYYAYYMLGLVTMKRKNYEAAIGEFDKAILVNPNFAPSNVAKGLAYYKLNQMDAAKREFEKARVKDSEFGLSSYNLAIAYFNEDLTNEAKSILESIRKSDPDFMDGEIQLAYIYFKENKLDEAEKTIDRVLKEEPSAEALFAQFRILDAKQKQSPSEKNKSKRNAVKEKILREYGETKYARLLPSDALDDEPLHVTDLNLSGTPVSTPIVYPNRIIVNYGTALVGYDRMTKELVWKQYTSTPFQLLVAGKELVGISNDTATKIYPESGKMTFKKQILAGWKVKQGSADSNGFYLLLEKDKSPNRKLVRTNPNLEIQEEWNGNDFIGFSINGEGKLFVIRDTKKEFLVQVFTPSVPNEKEPKVSPPIIKKDSKESANFLGCLEESCLVQLGGQIYEGTEKAKLYAIGKTDSVRSVVKNPDSLLVNTEDTTYLWKGGSKWKDSYKTEGDFYFPMDGLVVEGRSKELLLIKGREKTSVPWKGERDGLRISTITVD
ncbi:tetratricopeptide repeat protein [Leptospira bouyouniensis]|uniref:Tetratricopeptide repeat protein n=1 Tax=Leptospira bouyouniensis TaxID=2484911 RepID=A0ABY2L853_9LEPT|nr:tetratricopeptide repeat protein [Leptospira bouyouniensis]TGK52829.1 tetratricopeptide repeat protein [Leptospira bouyouniensis]